MKKTRIIYWVFTIPVLLMMGPGSIPYVTSNPDTVKIIHEQMGYPLYFIPLLGVAKILGSIALLIPGFPRVKEWVYAGFTFDVLAAVISMYMAFGKIDPFGAIFMTVLLAIIAGSYIYHHKLLKAKVEMKTFQ
jgi:uncharacterized membrane protein YphA (DoxX/SURF4 family)